MAQTALYQAELASIQTMANCCNNLLQNILPLLQYHNVLWNASGGWNSTIIQSWLDANPQLSGITVAELQSGLNTLFSVIMPGISGNEAALAQLAMAGNN